MTQEEFSNLTVGTELSSGATGLRIRVAALPPYKEYIIINAFFELDNDWSKVPTPVTFKQVSHFEIKKDR